MINKIIGPGGFFLGGLLLIAAGLGLNHYTGAEGELNLELGKSNYLSIKTDTSVYLEKGKDHQGLKITLDSLQVLPHETKYEIKLWKKDLASVASSLTMKSPRSKLIGSFSLEPLKIRKIENTDYRFRLKEFYPNFEFAYEYPPDRDSIKPKAPGITLELKTREGTPIVTLLSGQGSKHALGDIVSLGASLAFYWKVDRDSLQASAGAGALTGNKIVFSGADKKVYFILDGRFAEQSLNENTFYQVPGYDSTGFKIMYCFPDYSFLKAVPSSRGNDLLNPVAHVEIWKQGQGSIDAFVYPESSSRKGGEFEIPGTDYKIGLGIDQEQEGKFCKCKLTLQGVNQKTPGALAFEGGKPKSFHRYHFTPVDCNDEGSRKTVTMKVAQMPGKNFLIGGVIIALAALIIQFIRRK